MRMVKRKEYILPSAADSAPSGDGNSNSQHAFSATMSQLGGRRKYVKVIAFVAVMHCLYTVSKDQTSSIRRATSSTGSAFQANDKTLPLELMQAIQQASRAGSLSTPATELTSDSARSMTGAKIGGATNANEVPLESNPDLVQQLRALTPGDPKDVLPANESLDQDMERKLRRKKHKKHADEKADNSSGPGQGLPSAVPVDPSLLLHNLDPGAIQKMDAATLQKVMEVNNINPNALPSFSGAIPGAVGPPNETNVTPPHEAPLGRQGGEAPAASSRGDFVPDDIGNTILDAPGRTNAVSKRDQELASLLEQFGGNPGKLVDALSKLNGGSDAMPVQTSSEKQPQAQCIKAPRIPAPKQKSVRPTMNASYPGSGARLSWKLIRAVTGLMTSDDAVDTDDLAKNGVVVSIKSHYPAHGSNDALFKPFAKVDRSVVLIRNPMKAMPSFLSYLYEQENGLENHSTRVPMDQWIQWRDENFLKELQSWVHHTLFWMEHNAPENTMIIFYENLVNPETGPDELLRLGQFLEESSGEKMAQKVDDIPCVWDYVVNSRGDTSVNGKTPQSLRSGPKKFPYTDNQIDTMVHYLDSLAKIYPEALGPMMDRYAADTLALKSSPSEQTF